MPATQSQALKQNPNQIPLTQVACLDRLIDANLARVWENVLDWEHLPWLHSSSFDHVSLDEAAQWGWRTWSNPDKTAYVELCVDKENSRYVARSYQAGKQVSEIWTYLSARAEKTHIRVTFDLANVDASAVRKLGTRMLSLYENLWDEDEAMMIARQRRLDDKSRGPESIRLKKPVESALSFKLGRTEWQLIPHQDTRDHYQIVPTVCPHLLGPLSTTGTEKRLRCPWHGYEFDAESGDCISPTHAKCRLPKAPELSETESEVIISIPGR